MLENWHQAEFSIQNSREVTLVQTEQSFFIKAYQIFPFVDLFNIWVFDFLDNDGYPVGIFLTNFLTFGASLILTLQINKAIISSNKIDDFRRFF